MLATAPAAATDEPAHRFADVDPARFYGPAADWAQTTGLVTGPVPDCLAPDRVATRAEVAAVLQRLIAPEWTNTEHPFTDITADWQQIPVAWMTAREVTEGTSPSTFDPDGHATRAMVVTFLFRVARTRVDGSTNPFSDVVKNWQLAPVEWAWQNDITTGRTATLFAPDEPVTRGELLTFAWRWQGEPAPAAGLVAGDPVNCAVRLGECSDVFPAAAVADIEALAAGRVVTAHVHDHRTGCTYALNPGLDVTTASVIKAQVLAGVLLDAQDEGRAVTEADTDRIELMIHFSHNSPPTSELYQSVGGAAGMSALDDRFGLSDTAHTALYGATLSTAADRTRLVEQLLVGGGPLDDAHVAEAWAWMTGVTPAQTWGVTAGLPSDHAIALKNGFYPMTGRGWRLGSTGVVRTPSGGTYAVTIMTEGSATEADGIELVEAIAERINGALTVGEPAPRPVDEAVCVEAASGDTWDALAAVLATNATELRLVNGGEATPLRGQRVCAPPPPG
ncbi:MAG: S-layer homology domain-containing protein [Acidimicrobiales bacterium]|nr:S-layer homology domain-containing protein [Acidimicrobiales bacterium]